MPWEDRIKYVVWNGMAWHGMVSYRIASHRMEALRAHVKCETYVERMVYGASRTESRKNSYFNMASKIVRILCEARLISRRG